MSGGSIRFRLLIAAAASLIVAVAIAGIGLTTLFERHIERLVERDLTGYLNQLIAGIEISPDGTMSVAAAAERSALLGPALGTLLAGDRHRVGSDEPLALAVGYEPRASGE